MTCRRVRDELVELIRFGDPDPRSMPHLEHLSECRDCRDDIGLNRAIVRQLRRALEQRVEGASPSPDAWAGILARTQVPERSLGAWFRAHSSAVLARLRTATAVSGTALAVVLAVGTQVAITQPDPARFTVPSSAAGERFERQPLLSAPRSSFVDLDPVPVVHLSRRAPADPEQFMLGTSALLNNRPSVTPAVEEETEEEGVSAITFKLRPSSAPTRADGPDGDAPAPTSVEPLRWSPGPVSAEPS